MTRKQKKWTIVGGLVLLVILIWFFSLPDPLFSEPFSTVLEDRQQRLLGASIAQDGQWRFPEVRKVNERYAEALVVFEDKRFRNHPGVDVLSMARAIRQNLKSGKVISGGSTISMQVIRLSRKGKSRTFFEKAIEIFLATRLELRYTKDEILALYAAHAPFGGNVVGLEAACWRYFSRGPSELSWSEAALLAVLPNNPSLIHPGRNRERLKEKRNGLLQKLKLEGKFDALTLELAIAEPVPEGPLPLPRIARHLLDRISKEGHAQQRVVSTIDLPLQLRAEQIIDDHYVGLRGNQIFNAAAIVMEIKTGHVLAYVGNTKSGAVNQDQVDVAIAPRSTGSILKPFLFAAMLEDGKILPKTLVPDVPTTINGFSPRNFTHDYDGAVPADKALIRSLNIPAVNELRAYRYEKFHSLLLQAGLTTLSEPPEHYGLTLVLGGAEGSLWDIIGAYASMARSLNNFSERVGKKKYNPADYHAPLYLPRDVNVPPTEGEENSFLSAASIWLTFETLKEVFRPGEETGWKYFSSSKKIAWKTGTSFGFRDGWAVGVNGEYAVGVWTGNADGEGRPGLTGTETAAPIMFDLFSILPGQEWFHQPVQEMSRIAVCTRSGQRAAEICPETEMIWVGKPGLTTSLCSYHKDIHLSLDGRFRVHSDCEEVDKMQTRSWFVLPPVEEYYYRTKNLTYKSLPPFRKDCADPASIVSMDLIYPKQDARIYIPYELDGSKGSSIFEATHRSVSATIYWHLDGDFIGTTVKRHHIPVNPAKGAHILTLVDDTGQTIHRNFFVLSSQ